jgi:hypothetical protein
MPIRQSAAAYLLLARYGSTEKAQEAAEHELAHYALEVYGPPRNPEHTYLRLFERYGMGEHAEREMLSSVLAQYSANNLTGDEGFVLWLQFYACGALPELLLGRYYPNPLELRQKWTQACLARMHGEDRVLIAAFLHRNGWR